MKTQMVRSLTEAELAVFAKLLLELGPDAGVNEIEALVRAIAPGALQSEVPQVA